MRNLLEIDRRTNTGWLWVRTGAEALALLEGAWQVWGKTGRPESSRREPGSWWVILPETSELELVALADQLQWHPVTELTALMVAERMRELREEQQQAFEVACGGGDD